MTKILEKVEFSREDRRFGVKIPDLDEPLLAFEIGVHIGDGSLQMIPKGTNSIRFFGHKEDDWKFFLEILPPIIKKLFNKDVKPTKRKDQNTCILSICSKGVATFMHNIIGLPVGDKNQIQGLPNFIKENKNLLINCIRGIADTDFSLTFQKDEKGNNKYPTISCTMSNKNLIEDLTSSLEKLGFNVTTQFDVKRERNGKINVEHRLQILGTKQIEKWMKLIGFWNPHHMSKFIIWKNFDFYLPHTSLTQRLSIISAFREPKTKTP